MAHIKRMATVIRDGMHNAFTDLQYWQGAYWVGYRKGAGHVSNDARAIVAVSYDRQRFQEVASIRVPGDVRDPKLLPLNDRRMALYFPSWSDGYARVERNGRTYFAPLEQYITFTDNGQDWERPVRILDPFKWLWRIRVHQGRFYALIQDLTAPFEETGQHIHQLELAVSDDLLTWKTLARVGDGLNESDIHWRPDGEAWIVSRTSRGAFSVFASAKAPYTDWTTIDMQPLVHAPIMLEHQGTLYVMGRSNATTEGITDAAFEGAGMSMWRVTRGKLEPVLRFPASGDCSYPGLIRDHQGRICVSYYSQHAYDMGIIPRVQHVEDADHAPRANDVYFAEIILP